MSEVTSSDATHSLFENLRTTRELTPLEVEQLVEPERRYKPERDERDRVEPDPTASPAPVECQPGQRARTRTVRMRVLDFKPLPRPLDEVSTSPRGSRGGVMTKLLAALFVPGASSSCG